MSLIRIRLGRCRITIQTSNPSVRTLDIYYGAGPAEVSLYRTSNRRIVSVLTIRDVCWYKRFCERRQHLGGVVHIIRK